jgi:TolB-like protein/Tfp pilus assembly protein PilF
MSEPASAVFLSYASEDSVAAQRIAEALKAASVEVWFDKTELRGGDVWDRDIRARIHDCRLFIAVISANTEARQEGYFRREWRLAVDRTHDMSERVAFLIPVVIDDTDESQADVPMRFREVQWTRLPGGEAPQEFVDRIALLTKGAGDGARAARSALAPDGKLREFTSEHGPPGSWPPEKSLAVMPFANLSADRENEYFSDGLAEEILNALGGTPELRVAARSSSFYFKGRTTELQEIARRLRVAHIVEGSVRRVGNRVRVMAQLVDAHNGFQLWSERYDRELADVFEIQDEIARAIAGRLKVALLTGARRPTANMEAYELYLRGRHELHQRSRTSVQAAIQYFERCIALDPDYALAHAGLVDCYGLLPFRGVLSHAAAQARAQTAVQKAMELAPELWECNYARALYSLYFEGNWSESEQYFKQALEINPRAPMVNAHYGALHAVLGREGETVRHVESACKLDPLAPIVYAMGSFVMATLGKFTEGEVLAHHALELQPDHLWALQRHGFALSGLERHDEAVAALEEVVARSRVPIFTGVLGLVYARAGRHQDAQRLLQELEDRAVRGEFSVGIARLVLELGSNDHPRVRAAFTAALAEGAGAYHIKVACGPFIEPYRSDPEVDRLHRKLYGW